MTEVRTEYIRRERYGRRRRRRRCKIRNTAGSATDIAREAGRFVRAWADATSEVWVGATRVCGNLLGDLADTILDRRDDDDYDDDYDDDDCYYDDDEYYDDEQGTRAGPPSDNTRVEYTAERQGGDVRVRASVRSGPRRRRDERCGRSRDDMRTTTRKISHNVSDAIQESAHVVRRSLDRFSRSYDDTAPDSEEEIITRRQYGPPPSEEPTRGSQTRGVQTQDVKTQDVKTESGHILDEQGNPVEIKVEKNP